MKTAHWHVHSHVAVHARAPLRERLLGPAVLFILVVLFNWKLVLTNQFTWLESPDLAALVLPWFQFQAGLWHHGQFPMWDPNSWFGIPIIGQGEPGAAYPLNWLFFLVPLKHGWIREAALHWYFVLIHYGAALSCYALVRDLGRSRAASILAACVYALGGYVGAVTWPQMLSGAVWSPLVFLFMLRAARGYKPWASSILSGFFLGFGWLAGHHQMNLFVSIAAGGLWLWLIVRTGKPDLRVARLAAAAIIVAVMASALQTIPMAEYGRRAVRWAGADHPLTFEENVPYNVHGEFSLAPQTLLGIVMPNIQETYSPFVGIAAFTLALLGVMLAWKEQVVRWFAAIAAGGLLFSLGSTSLLHGVLYAVAPLVEKARVPAAGVIVFGLGIAPLVAFGADFVTRPQYFDQSRRAGWWLLGVTAALSLLEIVLWAAKKTGAEDNRVMITAFAAAVAAAILAGWRVKSFSATTGILALTALVLFELANVTNYNLPNHAVPQQNPYLSHLAEHGDLAAYIRNRGIAGRTFFDRGEVRYDAGDWYGMETSQAFDATVLSNIWNMDLFSPRAQDFFGVRYYVGKTPLRAEFQKVFTGRSGLSVFENSEAYPRAWSVHEATSLAESWRMAPALAAPQLDPRRTVLLSGEPAPALESCAGAKEQVEMPSHAANRVVITANLDCRGMVVLSDAWYPGWRAQVDGKPARIYEVDGGVRGVIVDAGQHVIEMRYGPWTVMLGGVFTALAAFLALIAARGRLPFHAV